MTEVSTSCIARAILEYLHQNRQAQDTLAGIAEWWLPKQQLAPQISIVKEAVALLMADDLIVEVKGKDSQSHYRLNEHKWAQIEKMVKQSP